MRTLTFDIVSRIDLLEEITKTEFSAQFAKLRHGLEKVISELQRRDFQPLSKEVDFELYINSEKGADFEHQEFEQTRFPKALLTKLHQYNETISNIESQRSKNLLQRKSKTKQPKIREREIVLIMLVVFRKNDLSLLTSNENYQPANKRFSQTLGLIFEGLSLPRELK